MVDVGFNMSAMRPLRIDSQEQNVGKDSIAGEFPRKKMGPKGGDWPFLFNLFMDSRING